jgi:hypothetical protein
MDTDTLTEADTPWLLTVPQLAAIVHRKETTICNAIRTGALKASDRKCGPYLITRAAAAAWLGLEASDIRSRCSEGSPGEQAAA